MMAGIGPFAVPAAKRGVRVFANDLNPASFEWLEHNVRLNRVERLATSSCEDARVFLRRLCAPRTMDGGAAEGAGASELLVARRKAGDGRVHVAMNLPASALEFLDVFSGLFREGAWHGELPTVHCYCFSKAKDGAAIDDARARAAAVLGVSLDGRSEVHVVRDVAPSKLMLCVTFVVPDEVGWARGAARAGGRGDAGAAGVEAGAHGGEVDARRAEEGETVPKRARTAPELSAPGACTGR